jgi:structure-specific endonuclease subunit SLX1
MMSMHPYKLWPLHVKLFTEEASNAWNDAQTKLEVSILPPGCTVVAEFEGVDGKSGNIGTGRQGPIDVTDGEYPDFIPSPETPNNATLD